MKRLILTILLTISTILGVSQQVDCPEPVDEFRFYISLPVFQDQLIGKLNVCDPDFDQMHFWDIIIGNDEDIWSIENGIIKVKDPYKVNSNLSYTSYIITVKVTDDGFFLGPLSDDARVIITPQKILNVVAYPNPFTNEIFFKYVLIDYQHVKISIYDDQCRLIENVVDEYQYPGEHTESFKRIMPTGIYFYWVIIGNENNFGYKNKIVKMNQ